MKTKILRRLFLPSLVLFILLIPHNSAVPALSIVNNTKTNDTVQSKLFINSSEAIAFYVTSSEPIDTWRWYSNNTNQNRNASNLTISYSTGRYHYVTANATNPNGTSNSVTWGLNVKPAMASSQMTYMNETPATDVMNAMSSADPVAFSIAAIAPFTNMVGLFFYVIVWMAYFAMIWIKQGTLNVPMVIGIIFGGLLVTFLPAPYQLVSNVLIVFGILAVVYVFYKGRG